MNKVPKAQTCHLGLWFVRLNFVCWKRMLKENNGLLGWNKKCWTPYKMTDSNGVTTGRKRKDIVGAKRAPSLFQLHVVAVQRPESWLNDGWYDSIDSSMIALLCGWKLGHAHKVSWGFSITHLILLTLEIRQRSPRSYPQLRSTSFQTGSWLEESKYTSIQLSMHRQTDRNTYLMCFIALCLKLLLKWYAKKKT